MKKLTYEAVHAWLKKHNSSTIVGTKHSSTSCPIAKFLRTLGVGDLDIVVDDTYYSIERWYLSSYLVWEGRSELPQWAKTFISKVDAHRYNNITAKVALKYLEASCD